MTLRCPSQLLSGNRADIIGCRLFRSLIISVVEVVPDLDYKALGQGRPRVPGKSESNL